MNKAQETLDRLLTLIQGDSLIPGQALPPERKLASLFGTSRNTIRSAIRVLEGRGLLQTRKGSGTYLLSKTERLGPWPTVDDHPSAENLHSLFEARHLFEPAIAGVSAIKIEIQHIDALERCLMRFSKAFVGNVQRAAADEDAEFRSIIARGTANAFFVAVMQRFASGNMAVFSHLHRIGDETRERLFADYVEIINALKAQNTTAAENGVARNLQNQYRILEQFHGDALPEINIAMSFPQHWVATAIKAAQA